MERENVSSTGLFLMVVCIAISLMPSCAGPELKVEPISLAANPSDDVAAFEKALFEAKAERVDVLSPAWFKKAERSLVETRALLRKGGTVRDISKPLSRGHAELKRARGMADTARATIPDAIEARRLARTAGAAAFESEYADVEENFLKLTQSIENDNPGSARRNQKKVAEAYHVLEIRAIKEHTLGKVRELLKQAEGEEAARFAPEMLVDVRRELEATDVFITTNPYATEEMQKRAEVARFKSVRLLELVRQAARIREMKPVDIAIWVEERLKQAADALGAADMRDQSFETQMDHIVGTITSLRKDRNFVLEQNVTLKNRIEKEQQRSRTDREAMQTRYDAEIEGLMTQVAILEGKSRSETERLRALESEKRSERERLEAERRVAEAKLAAERRFNELYNQVNAMFLPEEAECYKQGLQLVVRLRSMRFPVGQAVILPENYPLLSKVQRAIRSFGEPDVLIEGHTDSTGSAELNELLSQQRADAVSQYLLANGTVRKRQIVATGYGASKPLAPNATAEGRAVNRRIDVVLTPAKKDTP